VAALYTAKRAARYGTRVFAFFLWRWLAIFNCAGRNIEHALCPLVQIARAFGGLWSSDAAPCRNISKQHFVRLLIGFAPCRVRIRRSNNDWITLANRPTEPALVQWISLNPHREWMNFFHLFKLAHYRHFEVVDIERRGCISVHGVGDLPTRRHAQASRQAFSSQGRSMPPYNSASPDKLARLRRFFKSRGLVDCRADEKLSVGASLPRHSARLTSSANPKKRSNRSPAYEVARIE
jgi:hypothetical protein